MFKIYQAVMLLAVLLLTGCAHSRAVLSISTEIEGVDVRADWLLDDIRPTGGTHAQINRI